MFVSADESVSFCVVFASRISDDPVKLSVTVEQVLDIL